MTQPEKKLDLAFHKGDRVRPKGYFGTRDRFSEREVESVAFGGDFLFVGGKTGPRYDDITTGDRVVAADYEFACHHSGAPFERTTLHEEKSYNDGYVSGLALGIDRAPYQAGGPHVTEVQSNECRHLQQAHAFERLNNAAWLRGWKDGQERAAMKKKIDFKKPIRTVGDHRDVFVVGRVNPTSKHWLVNVAAKTGDPVEYSDNLASVVAVNVYGGRVNPSSFGFDFAIENVPETTKHIATAYFTDPDMGMKTINLGFTYEGDEIIDVKWIKE